MNVFPDRLMYTSVMNHYKMDHENLNAESIHQLFEREEIWAATKDRMM